MASHLDRVVRRFFNCCVHAFSVRRLHLLCARLPLLEAVRRRQQPQLLHLLEVRRDRLPQSRLHLLRREV